MSLEDIKINTATADIFRRSFNQDRLSHAYLFVGPYGTGKEFSCLQLVKYLNCENPALDEKNNRLNACDICQACRKIEKEIHPDLHIIRMDDKNLSIKIEQIKTLQGFFWRKAFEASMKVGIILCAENMTQQAQNALLKILEEPPKDSIILLTAASTHGLLDTVVSRCQIVRFSLVKTNVLANLLEQDFGVALERAGFLSRVSHGSLGRALDLNDEKFLDFREKIIRSCMHNDFFDSLSLDKADKKKQKDFLDILQGFYRDVMMFKLTGNKNRIVNIDFMHIIEMLAFSNSIESLVALIEKIGYINSCIDSNVNSKIAFGVLASEAAQLSCA